LYERAKNLGVNIVKLQCDATLTYESLDHRSVTKRTINRHIERGSGTKALRLYCKALRISLVSRRLSDDEVTSLMFELEALIGSTAPRRERLRLTINALAGTTAERTARILGLVAILLAACLPSKVHLLQCLIAA
jgi:hypothetical protein